VQTRGRRTHSDNESIHRRRDMPEISTHTHTHIHTQAVGKADLRHQRMRGRKCQFDPDPPPQSREETGRKKRPSEIFSRSEMSKSCVSQRTSRKVRDEESRQHIRSTRSGILEDGATCGGGPSTSPQRFGDCKAFHLLASSARARIIIHIRSRLLPGIFVQLVRIRPPSYIWTMPL
jgi:hypothetical protein